MKLVYIQLLTFVLVFLAIETKADDVVKKTLDAMQWQTYSTTTASYSNSEKEIYTYSTSGELLSSVLCVWSAEVNSWVFTDKVDYTYSNGFLIAKVYSEYSVLLERWSEIYKHEYGYSSDGYLVSDITFDKVTDTNVWVASSKEVNEYDANGNITQLIFSTKASILSPWLNVEMVKYTYSDDVAKTGSVSWVWDELLDDWVEYDSESYTYSNDGNTIDYIYSLWNITNGDWDLYYKEYSSLYNNDLNYGFLSSYWDETTSVWVDISQELHTFDADTNLLSYIEYEWNTNNSRWVFLDKETYSYDSFGNLLIFTDYNKDSNYNRWVLSTKEEYSYDLSMAADNLFLPFADGEIAGVTFHHQMNSIEQFVWNSSKWVNNEKAVLDYSLLTSLSNLYSTDDQLISIFPSVVANQITIQSSADYLGAMLDIFTSTGRKIYSKPLISPSQIVQLDYLVSGIYLVKVTTDGRVLSTHKIIKE